MRIIAAYLLAVLGGNDAPKSEDITRILSSVGIEADKEHLDLVLSKLKGKNVNELIALGYSKLATVGMGGGGGGGGGGAAASTSGASPADEGAKDKAAKPEAKKGEKGEDEKKKKKEEKEEEEVDEDMGSIFGGDDDEGY